jgi:glycosyltransferase involved in cell wall biosynthesis
MRQPLISVVIPCFNRQNYISQAIDSALSQTWTNVEVIVVDDGSTDGSIDILKSYGSKIFLICQENAGVAAARNVGIYAAKGDWIALLDSDDVWKPEKLRCQISAVQQWPGCVLTYTLCGTIDGCGELIGVPKVAVENRLETDALERLMHHCHPTTSSVMMNRESLLKLEGFDSDFEQGGGFAAEDWDLYIRLAETGPFAFVGNELALYRVHNDSKSRGHMLKHTLGLVALRRRIDKKFPLWRTTRPKQGIEVAYHIHIEQYAHVLGRLGLIYLKQRSWKEAANAFDQAVNIEPSRMKHRARRALAKIQAVLHPISPTLNS